MTREWKQPKGLLHLGCLHWVLWKMKQYFPWNLLKEKNAEIRQVFKLTFNTLITNLQTPWFMHVHLYNSGALAKKLLILLHSQAHNTKYRTVKVTICVLSFGQHWYSSTPYLLSYNMYFLLCLVLRICCYMLKWVVNLLFHTVQRLLLT